MSVADNKDLVRRYLEAASGREKTRASLLEYVSNEDLIGHVLEIEAGFPCYELDVLDLIAEEDRVAARLLFRGTHTGEFIGLDATGRSATMAVFAFYRIQDGRIADAWIQADGSDLIGQLTDD